MIRRPPRPTRTYTLFPYTTLFRSFRIPINPPTSSRNRRVPHSPIRPFTLSPYTVAACLFGPLACRVRIKRRLIVSQEASQRIFHPTNRGFGQRIGRPALHLCLGWACTPRWRGRRD